MSRLSGPPSGPPHGSGASGSATTLLERRDSMGSTGDVPHDAAVARAAAPAGTAQALPHPSAPLGLTHMPNAVDGSTSTSTTTGPSAQLLASSPQDGASAIHHARSRRFSSLSVSEEPATNAGASAGAACSVSASVGSGLAHSASAPTIVTSRPASGATPSLALPAIRRARMTPATSASTPGGGGRLVPPLCPSSLMHSRWHAMLRRWESDGNARALSYRMAHNRLETGPGKNRPRPLATPSFSIYSAIPEDVQFVPLGGVLPRLRSDVRQWDAPHHHAHHHAPHRSGHGSGSSEPLRRPPPIRPYGR